MPTPIRALALATLLLVPLLARAQTAPVPAGSVTELDAVTVNGVQPGPGLWQVRRGGHVLWILATLSPLPEKMQWQTADVEQAIADSQVVLGSPGAKLDTEVGFFGKLFLLPSLLKARKNPDGARLVDLVSADDYARWQVLKAKYIGRDGGVERWRPLFAALELYRKALKKSDLDSKASVTDTVRDLARRHDIPLINVTYHLKVDDLRGAIKAFTRSGPNDLECFHRAVSGLETELPLIRARANAWATGDLDALRALPADGARQACLEAITEAGFARQLGLADLPARVRDTWLSAADKALLDHAQSFAVLPLEALIGPQSALPGLRARGYTVTAPDEVPAPDDADTGGMAPAASTAATAPPGR
ncbi:TraB/GumN family protein [Dyella sp.]|uniref:TraB/GumN family protein n=1 Tax=Dyella sp. TaxID=1869338 RepID=UPI002D7650CB|nr:TraB/GumN family protein [Dyella sp.]HET6431332.1 TraB/GumN family protein [Dyella sp.]